MIGVIGRKTQVNRYHRGSQYRGESISHATEEDAGSHYLSGWSR